LLTVALYLSRLTNEIPPGLSTGQWANLGNGAVYYFAAGGVTGTVSRVLRRSAHERARAIEEATRERERAARLAERDAIGRRLHDSVLQTLALIEKRGRELSRLASVPAEQVRTLVGLAADQERELRALLNEGPDGQGSGPANLGSALRFAAAGITTVPITITATGDARMPASDLAELAAAVRQALQNAEAYARATSVTVFAEEADDQVVVTVKDDGTGFDYDEERLVRDGKLGLLRSIKARIESVGGAVRVETAPGRGTEIELRVPVRQETARG
jgi:signal transduction histidine kinase